MNIKSNNVILSKRSGSPTRHKRSVSQKKTSCVYITKTEDYTKIEDFGSMSKSDRKRCKTERKWYISEATLMKYIQPWLIIMLILSVAAKEENDDTFYEAQEDSYINRSASFIINIGRWISYYFKYAWVFKWTSAIVLCVVTTIIYLLYRTLSYFGKHQLPKVSREASFKIRGTPDQFESGLVQYITLCVNGKVENSETTEKYVKYENTPNVLKRFDEDLSYEIVHNNTSSQYPQIKIEKKIKKIVRNMRVSSNEHTNKLFGYFTLGEWVKYFNQYADEVKDNYIIHNKYDDKYEWNEDIYKKIQRVDELKIKMKYEKDGQNRKILDDTITDLSNDIGTWEIPNNNKLLITNGTCKYKINYGHNIFAIPMYVSAKENPDEEIQNFFSNFSTAIEYLLAITEFGDVRTDKSGNVELTVLEKITVKGTLLNKVNQTKYKKDMQIWYPLKLNDTIQTKVYKNGKADMNLVNAVINQEAGLDITYYERNLLYTQANTYLLAIAVESKSAYDYTMEACEEMRAETCVNDGARRLCRKIKRLTYTMWQTATWGELVKYTTLLLRAVLAVGSVLPILYMLTIPDDLPGWYLVPLVEYREGPMCKWPKDTKPHKEIGKATESRKKEQHKCSRTQMTEEIPDAYNTSSVENLRCAIEARCLADNRTRSFVLPKNEYALDPKYWDYYEIDKAKGLYSTVGRALKSQFGRFMEEKADEIAEEIIREMGVDTISEIEKEAFREFLNSKAYSQSQIEKMLKEVPDILVDEKDFKSVNHTWNAFVKQEEYETQSRPRGIQGASSVHKMIGVALEKMQHTYFSRKQCIKTIPINERPEVLMARYKGTGFLYQTDHSSFEGAQLDDIRVMTEFRIFQKVFPNIWNLMNIIWRQGKPLDYHKIKEIIRIGVPGDQELWIIDSIRMSGSPDTSVGNTMVNECVTHALIKSQGVNDYVATFEGDDALIMTKQELDVEKLFDDSVEAGFKLKLDIRDHVYDAGFLSLYWDPETLVIRSGDLSKCLRSVFTHYENKLKELGEDAYLRSKMLSAAIQNPGNKFMYYLFNKTQELCKGAMLLPNDYWTKFKLDSLKIKWVLDEKLNKLRIVLNKALDISGFLRTEQWDVPDDINHEYWIEQLDKVKNKTQLYELVRDFIDLTQPFKTGIIDKIGYYSQQIGSKFERFYSDKLLEGKSDPSLEIGSNVIASGNNVNKTK